MPALARPKPANRVANTGKSDRAITVETSAEPSVLARNVRAGHLHYRRHFAEYQPSVAGRRFGGLDLPALHRVGVVELGALGDAHRIKPALLHAIGLVIAQSRVGTAHRV